MRHVRSDKNTRVKRDLDLASAMQQPRVMSWRVDSGSRQTLLVLQFVIEFANIWAQYSPSTYASTDVGFFLFVP